MGIIAHRLAGRRRRAGLTALIALAFGATGTSGALAASASSASFTGISAGCAWQIHELPLPAGWTSGSTEKNDGVGVIAGSGKDPRRGLRPVLWQDGVMTELPSPGDLPAMALDVNRSGVVLATTNIEDGNDRPYLVRNGQVERLDTTGYSSVSVSAINDAGLIVGSGLRADDTWHAVTWSARQPGTLRELASPAPGFVGVSDVTNRGQIVGMLGAFTPDQEQALAGRVSTGLTALPKIHPELPAQADSAAGPYIVGLNGYYSGGTVEGHSILWKNKVPHALPTNAVAVAVNAEGVVAGLADAGTAAAAPAVWVGDRTWTLPDLSAELPGTSGPTGVLSNGTVTGIGSREEGLQLPVTWSCESAP